MPASIDKNTLQRLIALGKRKGQLSPEDLFAELPVDCMSAEDIALVVLEIEEAGVPVELEDTLLTLSRPTEMRPMAEPIALATAPQPLPINSLKLHDHTAAYVSTGPVKLSAGAAADDLPEGARINQIVALASALTLLILGGGLLLLGW